MKNPPARTYSLLTVHRTNPNGTIDGCQVQDHTGTLESARDQAKLVSAKNGGMDIAVVASVGDSGFLCVYHDRRRLA